MSRIEIGKRIREARLEKGYTQQALAEATGIGEMYISQIERGVKMPSLNLFTKIISALDISSDYVLRDTLPSGKSFVYEEVAELLDTALSPILFLSTHCTHRLLDCAFSI